MSNEGMLFAANEKNFTVVIDAGHGGKDVGAQDNGIMEKNINLKVARQLENLIKKKLKGSKVVMTREDDTYLTLQQRADKANKAQGDLFISIHTNSVDKKNKNRRNLEGSSVYTLGLHKDDNNLEVARRENSVIELETDYEQKYSGFDPQRDESYIIFEMAQKKNLSHSIKFAENVEKELVGIGRQNRGVHQAGFWVLWATSMPSVLIELDFICNPQSAKYISSDKGAKEMAEAIFRAVEKYEASWNRSLKAGSSDLSDSYISGEEERLGDSYTLLSSNVVKTKTRIPEDSSPQENRERRRRSQHSRDISSIADYEKDNISFGTGEVYAVEQKPISPEKELAAISYNKGKNKDKKRDNKKGTDSKKKKEKEPSDKDKKNGKDSHGAKLNKLVTVYKIQILASADLLSQNNSRFCGLSPISTFKENNLYKYYYGESTDRNELESILADVRKKIPDAFIVSSQKSMQTK